MQNKRAQLEPKKREGEKGEEKRMKITKDCSEGKPLWVFILRRFPLYLI
jgi:hypothetical protein